MTEVLVSPCPCACLAFDFGGSKVAIALFEQSGEVSIAGRIEITADMDAEMILRAAVDAGRRMIGHRSDVVIGAVCPGVLHAESTLLAPNVAGWGALAFERRLRELFESADVFVDNDVKAAARAESEWGQLKNLPVGLYVNLGTGIAAALVVNGEVIRGANGAAGEIGYGKSSVPDLVLEDIVGAQAIFQRTRMLDPRITDLAGALSRSENETEVGMHIEFVLAEVARVLQHAVYLVDPNRIVVGGGLAAFAPQLLPRLQVKLVGAFGRSPEISVAAFGTNSSLHGARLVGVERG
jgi:glucokinase